MTAEQFSFWLEDPGRRPLVMGILNVTPDSFSDGGRFSDVELAVKHGEEMVAAGADLIDVGGESTRPGSPPVASDEQIRRVVPVIRALYEHCLLSIDTSRAEVATAALDAGAGLVNDIFAGLDDPQLLPLVAKREVPAILMHMQGRPPTMQANPTYGDVVCEVAAFLRARVAAAIKSGVSESGILIDPGIGFGKQIEHNLELLGRLEELKSLGRPIVVGTSRKGFIEKITGETIASGRPFGTVATVAWSVANGADIVRVHDVGPMSQVVRMIEAIKKMESPHFPRD